MLRASGVQVTPVTPVTPQGHSASWQRGQPCPDTAKAMRPAFAHSTSVMMPRRTSEVTFTGVLHTFKHAFNSRKEFRVLHLPCTVRLLNLALLTCLFSFNHACPLPPHIQSDYEVPFSTARAESLFRAESRLLAGGPAPRVPMADGILLPPSTLGPALRPSWAGGALQPGLLGTVSRPSVGGSGAPQSSNVLQLGYGCSFVPEAPSRFSREGAPDLLSHQRGTDAVQVWEAWEVF